MNTLSAQAAAWLLLAAVVADVRHDLRRLLRGRNVVLAGIFAWYLLEALTLSPAVQAYRQPSYDYGVFVVVAAMLAFLAGYHATRTFPLFLPMASTVSALDDRRMLWRVVAVCAMVGFTPVLFYSDFQLADLLHGILGMRQTWGGLLARGRLGGLREALLQAENLVIGAGAFATILLLDRRSTLLQRVVGTLVVVWPVLRGFGSGTRNSFLLAAIPILAVLYLRCQPQVQRWLLVLGLLLTPLVYGLMAAIVGSRDSGAFSWEARKSVTYVGNEMFQELLYVSASVPDRVPYQWGKPYLVQIFGPVPRFLWPGKPTLDSSSLLAKMRGEYSRRTGEANYTRTPGILGEMYLNFGLPGVVLLSLLSGWIIRGWDRIADAYDHCLPTMVFYLAGLGVLFFMGRCFSAQLLYPLGFFVAAVWVLARLEHGVRFRPDRGPP